ncbi:MAG: tadE-2 [Gemmatimonadetes bacterium]|jgi:Flp pilus assembly protein TadG|nr:tadE-2 [Gemmatimonadota bacterium]
MKRVRLLLRRNRKGAAIVEFALVVPLLLILLWGIVDIGRAFYTLNNLASAVREGARSAAVMATDPTIAANKTLIKSTVTTAFTPIGPALKPESVFVTLANRQVTVQASYPFAPLVLVGWTFPVRRSAIFRWEQAP